MVETVAPKDQAGLDGWAGWTSDREHPGHDGREGRVVAREGFGCRGLAGNVLTVAGMGEVVWKRMRGVLRPGCQEGCLPGCQSHVSVAK